VFGLDWRPLFDFSDDTLILVPRACAGRRLTLAGLVFSAGVAFSLILLSFTREDSFFSGDGGVKFLLTRQFANGELHPDLRLPADAWAKALWRDGFYPYAPPFVYALGKKHFINTPVFFSAITAIPYRLIGWRGLYVVPVVSLWITWILFVGTCRRLQVRDTTVALALFALIFASPLTLYGALYWEHTIGVALAFGGLSFVIATPPAREFRAALSAGTLLGVSVWFRSEMYALIAVVLVLVALAPWLRLGSIRRLPLAIGVALAVGVLLAFNQFTYGNLVGMHAIQVLESAPATGRAENAGKVFVIITWLLIKYFPLVLPAVGLAVMASWRPRAVSGVDRTLISRRVLWTSAFFPLGVALIAPNLGTGGDGGLQWGPRFLLVLIPLLCLLVAIGWEATRAWQTLWRASAQSCIVVTIVTGAVLNGWLGPRTIAQKFALWPTPLERLRSDPAEVVVFGKWWMPQHMAGITAAKQTFLAADTDALGRLSSALLARGVTRFLYVSYEPKSLELPLDRGTLHIVADQGSNLTPTALGAHEPPVLAINEATLQN
jgi:hypothetical protein